MSDNNKEINYEEKYKKLRANVKKANIKFIENNRELVNERAREYYKRKLKNNPDFLAKRREYYHKKKEAEQQSNNDDTYNSTKIILAI